VEPLFKFLRLCMDRSGKLPSNLTPKILAVKFAAWKKLTGVKDGVHKMRKGAKATAKRDGGSVLRESRRVSHARSDGSKRKAKSAKRLQGTAKGKC
jgi:hypothetical protein